MLLLERTQLAGVEWGGEVIAPLAAFAGALFLFYSLVPAVLILSGATVLNLSLLSSDLWAALARVALFGGFGGSAGYFVASLVLVGGGIGTYGLAGPSKQPEQQQRAGGLPGRGGGGGYQLLRDEQSPDAAGEAEEGMGAGGVASPSSSSGGDCRAAAEAAAMSGPAWQRG